MSNFVFERAANIINRVNANSKNRNQWVNSQFKNIINLVCDASGRCGEMILSDFCKDSNIPSNIDGTKTKQIGGGIGDGTINGRTVEIKTARRGSCLKSFQHELGLTPWKSEFMIFIDISPNIIYITILPNFTEEFYKSSASSRFIKCKPYFPSKKITRRGQKGAFKLDTTVKITENNVKNNYTFKFTSDDTTDIYIKFKEYVDNIIN